MIEQMKTSTAFKTRFAPSPNGWLHLGHAYSALTGADLAAQAGGQFIVRLEDIDVGRARPHFVDGIYQDLEWLGLDWPQPVMVQSERFEIYQTSLNKLRQQGLVYPCWATRRDISNAIAQRTADGESWPRDPDGAPLYPGLYRDLPDSERRKLMWEGGSYAWRLDMQKAVQMIERNEGTNSAPFHYIETASGKERRIAFDPLSYGDVVLARKDVPTSYHLAVVVDDAAQNITHVTRGQDLAAATSIHIVLQKLLGLPTPLYHHHGLVRDTSGRRLSKQAGDSGFRELRQMGLSVNEVKALLPPPFGNAEI